MADRVNDVHSRLNATQVSEVLRPRDIGELRAAVVSQDKLAVSGCRHAMGGQQFAGGEALLDLREMSRIVNFDAEAGLLEMEAGATWPTVIEATTDLQPDGQFWAIRQKQTGADDLSLGGAVSANVHGRGLGMKPLVDDIEALQIVTADGELVRCSRAMNSELFRHVVGGYGLFGVIATVTLRLGRRRRLRRLVDVLDLDEAIPAVRRRASEGCIYGDFQYVIDTDDDGFLRRGVCACYTPVETDESAGNPAPAMSSGDWAKLIALAYTDKAAAFGLYAQHYLGTHGNTYWSDDMQLSTYLPNYAELIPGGENESLMIGEMYVPPENLLEFMEQGRRILRSLGVENIYGTVRTIQPESDTALPWAKQHWACVIFNLRTAHTDAGRMRTAKAFGKLIDAALSYRGSFYLTYGRYADRKQIERAYPEFDTFLNAKRSLDPAGRFTSDWYRHHRKLFGRRE